MIFLVEYKYELSGYTVSYTFTLFQKSKFVKFVARMVEQLVLAFKVLVVDFIKKLK